jgi:hypothetical protein
LSTVQDVKEIEFLRANLLLLLTQQERLLANEQRLRAEVAEMQKYPVGATPFPVAANVGFGEDVWAAMSEHVQQDVLQLMEARKALAGVKALTNMSAKMTPEQAKALGITVLHAEGNRVLLGTFSVHANISNVSTAPKGLFAQSTSSFLITCTQQCLFLFTCRLYFRRNDSLLSSRARRASRRARW